MMSEKRHGPLSTLFGTFYPTDYVVAVFDEIEQADQALAQLRQAGWPEEEVGRQTGEAVLANHQATHAHQNLFQRIGHALSSDEGNVLEQYLDEARAGHAFVTAYAPTKEQTHKASAILASYGGYRMRHYGEWTFSDIPSHLTE
jgi:hypothetical protein